MARAAGVEWKAVGASLDTLASTMRSAAKSSAGAFAYANSGVLQQAGVILKSRYIVPGGWQELTKSGYSRYTEPPGATHGPVVMAWKRRGGEAFRNERGQFVKQPIEIKLLVKGKFVDRSGGMLGFADDLAAAGPTEALARTIAEGETGQKGKRSAAVASIDANGIGSITLSDGYAAAERGSRRRATSPVRGVWKSLRSVSARWGTLLRKKYPDLLHLKGAK